MDLEKIRRKHLNIVPFLEERLINLKAQINQDHDACLVPQWEDRDWIWQYFLDDEDGKTYIRLEQHHAVKVFDEEGLGSFLDAVEERHHRILHDTMIRRQREDRVNASWLKLYQEIPEFETTCCTAATLRKRGWTDILIKRFLKPVFAGPAITLYSLEKVAEAEKDTYLRTKLVEFALKKK